MIRTPPPRAPQARPRTGGRPMPPDVSALAGNDHQDRVLARAPHGTIPPELCGLASVRWALAAARGDREYTASPSPVGCRWARITAMVRADRHDHGRGWVAFLKIATMSSTVSSSP